MVELWSSIRFCAETIFFDLAEADGTSVARFLSRSMY
jgi:hypothetical protein